MHISESLHARENNFDFLRFAAALLVLFSHCYPLVGRADEEPIVRFTGYFTGGGVAVAVFFVISGYLITASYQNSRSSLDYAVKRAVRLLPGLALVVLLTLLVLGPIFSRLTAADYFAHPQTWAYLTNLVFLMRYQLPEVFVANPYGGIANGSLWTLPAEVVMYIGIAALGWIRRLDKGFIAFVVLAGVTAYFSLSTFLDGEASTIPYVRQLTIFAKLSVFFFSGALLYLVRRRIRWHPGVALILIIALWASFRTAAGHYVLFITLPYLVLYAAHAKLGALSGFGKFGDFSYGLYIFAFPIQQIVIALSPAGISITTLFILSTVLTLICAAISWHLVESPVLRWNQNRLARAPLSLQAQAG